VIFICGLCWPSFLKLHVHLELAVYLILWLCILLVMRVIEGEILLMVNPYWLAMLAL
jgi:hypothetical protein